MTSDICKREKAYHETATYYSCILIIWARSYCLRAMVS